MSSWGRRAEGRGQAGRQGLLGRRLADGPAGRQDCRTTLHHAITANPHCLPACLVDTS